MTAPERNFLASICLQYVKFNDPASFEIMKQLAEENLKPHSPRYNVGYIYHKFLELKEANQNI